ncbi:hypothetical protein SAMN05421823_105328 [Catalinimonas alkaloidigena]|uniref:Uncharacterized protein n=1 Tax=Catalinimonas alkaloidigena TaxID=1075417 RepID=A0A1G9JIN2_9BACT|nr:hypothetical protein SAMN05421823_105328 [Catalinimonas alkaloidigena]
MLKSKKKSYYSFYYSGVILCILGTGSLISIGLEDYNSAIPTFITVIPFAVAIIKSVINDFWNIT